MKPLNLDNSPCSPISSNCVIWQGPHIPCIKLCTGDTVSDVVFKLATELCEILEQLNVSNYDLACLNLAGCDPKDFQTLIQILINKICDLQNKPVPVPDNKSGGCPIDCIVEVAECFGGGTDNLINYVDRIGKKICELIEDISTLQDQVANLDIRVTVLENAPTPTFTIPSFTLQCAIGTVIPVLPAGSSQQIDTVLRRFINEEWCPYKVVLDTTTALSAAILSQCVDGTDTSLQFQYSLPATQMQIAYPSYVATPTTLADAINNLWIALCDARKEGKKLTAVAAGTGVTVTSATAVVGNDQVTTYTVSAGATHPALVVNETDCGGGISNTTDVYAYIDITSGPYNSACTSANQNRLTLCTALKSWHDTYTAANPSYTGNLYVFILQDELYLDYPNQIKNGNITGSNFSFLNLTTGLTGSPNVPPNWNTPSWVAPTDLLYVAFVNETNDAYHESNNPVDFAFQPTTIWDFNRNQFISDYTTHWNFFRGVIYPAVNNISAGNLCLQAFGATNNIASITATDFQTALGPNAISGFIGTPTYPIANPYVSQNKGIWDYGWSAVLDKGVVPNTCIINFTPEEFASDLNAILSGAGGDCTSASIVQSWDETTQELTLRGIKSCSLDISVDEGGCINIEGGGSTGCPVFVNITDASTIQPLAQKATATVSGGVAPYSYQWSFGDWSTSPIHAPGYYQFVGATNTATVEYEVNPLAPALDSSQYQLLKVIITDANGCKVSDTFLIIRPYVPA